MAPSRLRDPREQAKIHSRFAPFVIEGRIALCYT
jgi:hypothetical protein